MLGFFFSSTKKRAILVFSASVVLRSGKALKFVIFILCFVGELVDPE